MSFTFKINYDSFYPLLLTAFAIGVIHFTGHRRNSSSAKWLFILLCDVFLFLSALYCCFSTNIKNRSDYFGHFVNKEKLLWQVNIEELPREKDKFIKVKLNVLKNIEDTTHKQLTGEAIVYFKKPINPELLKPGNILQIRASFHEINKPLNPYEFDYNGFMAKKNIHYQAFVESENVKLISENNSGFSLLNFGLNIKSHIINSFKNSGLEPDAANLCSALITGYDDEINSETINAFAHSGTLHVLSVSGLHIGILYGTVVLILGFLDKNKKFKLIQSIVVLSILFVFTLITGFSPPVMRAAIMLSLLMIGRSYFNYSSNNSMNIIAVSAFIILVADPLLLFDAGFLLSYSAVIGILFFEPYFSALFSSDNYLFKKIGQLCSVSIAAQVGTLPLALVLFHQFPIWFVFTNLLIIPMCSVIMFLGAVILMKGTILSSVVNFLTKIVFWAIHLTDAPGSGYLDKIDFSGKDALLLTGFIITISLAIKARSFNYMISSILIVIIWQCDSLIESYNKKRSFGIGIYQVSRHSSLDLKNRTQLFFKADSLGNNYDFHVKPNHTAHNYTDQSSVNFDYVKKGHESFFHLNNQSLLPVVDALSPDYVLISNQVKMTDDLLEELRPKLIIADGTNGYSFLKELKEQCSKFAIDFYSTKEKGYLNIELK